jgi:hypothetical protein
MSRQQRSLVQVFVSCLMALLFSAQGQSLAAPGTTPEDSVRALESARGQALLHGIADNTGMLRGFPFSGKIRYTRIFVRRDGRWQALAMQQTSMP